MATDKLDKSQLATNTGENEKVTIELYNKDIDAAMTRIDNGEFTTHEDIEKEMESW